MAGPDAPAPGGVSRAGSVGARVGQILPALSLPSTNGRSVDLGVEAQERHLVLFFYPGDRDGLRFPELQGCTAEACALRDHASEMRALGAEIYGISTGTTTRQQAFAEREGLTFQLLSDPDHRLIDALGIPLWRSAEGERFVSRTTFIIGRGGRIANIFEDVEVPGHLDAVLSALQELTR
jgi:peroxiredoxin Q/BCP